MNIKQIKKDKDGKKFQADGFKIYYKNKGTISGDNAKNVKEVIYLISGKAEITLKNKTWKVQAPSKLKFPKKTFHKITALTDIIFLVFNK